MSSIFNYHTLDKGIAQLYNTNVAYLFPGIVQAFENVLPGLFFQHQKHTLFSS